jgi:hypothetical protein
MRRVLSAVTLLIVLMLLTTLAPAAGRPPIVAVAAQAEEAGCPLFPPNNPLNEDISHAPVDPNSSRYIQSIGADRHLHPSFGSEPAFGMPYAVVGPDQPKVKVRFTGSPRSSDPGPYPIPADAPVQGAGVGPGDHHLLVLQSGTCKLYEMYRARRTGSSWEAGSGAVFDLRSNALRPDRWTSADAAGLPIFPLLARYQEVRRGAILHALGVTVEQTQCGFIHPATHCSSSSTDPRLPPMGLRLRLKRSFNLSGYHGQALIVLNALKTFGLIVADEGGSWDIAGATNPGWNDKDLHQLESVPGSAFEAVSSGPIVRGGAHRRAHAPRSGRGNAAD